MRREQADDDELEAHRRARAKPNRHVVPAGGTILIPYTDLEEERLWREFVAGGYKDSRAYRAYVRSKERA